MSESKGITTMIDLWMRVDLLPFWQTFNYLYKVPAKYWTAVTDLTATNV